MINPWWSFVLANVGALGLVFTMRQSMLGPVIGLLIQFLWIAYGLYTRQWGFIESAFVFGAANIYGIVTWRKKRKADAGADRESIRP